MNPEPEESYEELLASARAAMDQAREGLRETGQLLAALRDGLRAEGFDPGETFTLVTIFYAAFVQASLGAAE